MVLFYPTTYTFHLTRYADVDYAGFLVDHKSTLGVAHFVGSTLIYWGTKKQKFIAFSTTEVEYVCVTSYYAQLLWIKKHLENFDIFIDTILLLSCVTTLAQ